MSHFKYEINERNLRLQLKESVIPFSDEAWQKFESFDEAHKINHSENVMKRFQVSLNRNIVLPVVFGAVIILFSLLLFNFVNIKNPNPETAEIKQAAVVSTRIAAPKKEPAPAKEQVAAPVQTKDSANNNVNLQPGIKNNAVESAKAETPVAVKHIKEANVNPVISITEAKSQNIQETTVKPENRISAGNSDNVLRTEPPQKKKHKKRELIVTEPTAEEDSQLPPPVSQNSASGRETQ